MAIDKLSDNYQLRILTLSPVHIGTGKEKWLTRNLDYFIYKRKIIVINPEKLMAALVESEVENGVLAYDKFCRIHSGKRGNTADAMWELLEEADIPLEEIEQRRLDYSSEPADIIHTFVRNGFGQVILPGSSVKGAIRSTIFQFLHDPAKKETYERRDPITNKQGNPNKDVLGDFNKIQFMEFIRPVDVTIKETVIQNCDLYYVSTDTKKSRIDSKFSGALSLEVIPSGSELVLNISLASDAWLEFIDKITEGNKRLHGQIRNVFKHGHSLQQLFFIINSFSSIHLQREIKFYRQFSNLSEVDNIIKDLEIWKRKTENNPRSCVLRLGAGSGFHCMTGDWRFIDHRITIDSPDALNKVPFRSGKPGPAPYKTRKWTFDAGVYQPLGFIEMFLPDELPNNFFTVEGTPYDTQIIEENPLTSDLVNAHESTLPSLDKDLESNRMSSPERTDFLNITIEKGVTIFDAEVVHMAKPFPRVNLLLNNYPFDDTFAELTGSKNKKIDKGDFIKVIVKELNKNGKVSIVSIIESHKSNI